ncbi:MAG: ATPase, T2SS/T4P/T4SS family, partial [Oscillospiraceae bacterium]
MLISDKGSNYPVSMEQLLREAVALNGSDLHLVAIRRPTVRVSGKMRELDYPQAQPIDLEKLVLEVINDRQKKQLEENLELDFSYSIPKCARFRGNIAFQRGTLAVVFRVVPFEVPELSNLALPRDVERLCTLTRGLILVTGPTGSGKSTTMAAMLGRINQTRSENIITIEDPIEFLHSHNMSTVIQREVGVDTLNFGSALRMALRHDPDVIMIGEMRD